MSHLLFGIDPGDRELGFAIMGYGYRRGGGGASGGLAFAAILSMNRPECRQVLECASPLALGDGSGRPKAPEDWRTPRREMLFRGSLILAGAGLTGQDGVDTVWL